MCRWLAYSGRPIYLDAALFEPENSLIEQSLHARHGRWLFMHNGAIGGYNQVRHQLDLLIDPAFYPRRAGTTDSETFFYLMLSHGLEEDAEGALARTIAQVVAVMEEAGVDAPFHMTAALSNGARVHALRWSNDRKSPSLFHGKPCFDAARGAEDEAVAILSEPLDSNGENWTPVPEGHLLVAEGSQVTVKPFSPAA